MTQGQPTESQIAQLASGDAGAWRCVVTWLQPRLDGFFIAGRAADHQALTQEVFLRMSRSIAQFTDGGADELAAWAFAIARTTRIDAARRASVRPDTVPESALGAEGSTPLTHSAPDTTIPHDEQVAALDRVEGLFAQLTDQQAELLRLRIHGDVTLELAAKTLGMELGAAKQLQRRALRRLATLLAGEDDDPRATAPGARDDDTPTQLLPGRMPSGTPP